MLCFTAYTTKKSLKRSPKNILSKSYISYTYFCCILLFIPLLDQSLSALANSRWAVHSKNANIYIGHRKYSTRTTQETLVSLLARVQELRKLPVYTFFGVSWNLLFLNYPKITSGNPFFYFKTVVLRYKSTLKRNTTLLSPSKFSCQNVMFLICSCSHW